MLLLLLLLLLRLLLVTKAVPIVWLWPPHRSRTRGTHPTAPPGPGRPADAPRPATSRGGAGGTWSLEARAAPVGGARHRPDAGHALVGMVGALECGSLPLLPSPQAAQRSEKR